MTLPVALAAALADRYELVRELGAGGMATVYLARDVRHAREVAIKVLHPELAAVLGAERFLSEIRTTASLQHPHILPLFDSGEAAGQLFYVMPFVDGETLRSRLEREKQLPIADAVLLAREVADALQYAHDRGVIHRDIKPENILLQGGHALVADFGIALAVTNAGGARMTQTGLSLGTPQYMAPEQAMGERTVDARADVYALGAVTYEMLAGEPPFTGPTSQAIVAKVLTTTPAPLLELRATVPMNAAVAVAAALQKLPADRPATARAFADALISTAPLLADAGTSARTTREPRTTRSASRAAAIMRASALLLAGAGAMYLMQRGVRSAASAEPEPVRFVVEPPPVAGLTIAPSAGRRGFAISPDGREIAFRVASADGITIYRRQLSELTVTPVPGTTAAYSLTYSPDGERLAFSRLSSGLFVVPKTGGTPNRLLESMTGSAIAWESGSALVFARGRQVWRVSASGTAEPIVKDSLNAVAAMPHLLPENKGVVFTMQNIAERTQRLTALRFADSALVPLGLDGTDPRYVEAGYLLFVSGSNTVSAIAFDPVTLRTSGQPVVVLTDVNMSGFGAMLDVARNGSLIYEIATEDRQVVRVLDRTGKQVGVLPANAGGLGHLRVSPTGDRLAYEAAGKDGGTDIFVLTRATGQVQRLTQNGSSRSPEWSADGAEVFWLEEDAVRINGRRTMRPADRLLRQRVDGLNTAQLVPLQARQIHNFSLAPDGRRIALSTGEPGLHILTMASLTDGRTLGTYGVPDDDNVQPNFSPDGRWVAYVSHRSGEYAVYVAPADSLPLSQLISENIGNAPMWSGDGRTIYYSAGVNMMAATLSLGRSIAVQQRDQLFVNLYREGARDRSYDFNRRSGEFVMAAGAQETPNRLVVILNWFTELRRKMAAAKAMP
ncbi:MAG: serine/threonine-protein kinase [Gemmatimonadaceae bacterium]|nr:serine/threonine-protein kinase [Gemmatimonadaceae bacterium]